MSTAQPAGDTTEGQHTTTLSDEQRLIQALRAGDEEAFMSLVDRHHASLVRVAMMYVRDRGIAEEVAQETWLGLLHGLDRFEGRSALKTWIFRILVNQAKTRGRRESRSVPFSTLWDDRSDADQPSVDPQRFLPPDHPTWPGHWASLPSSWDEIPEDVLLSQETHAVIQEAIAGLPPNQREVITLRDIEGWTSEEVCNILEITDTNQRVRLHRARSAVRRALENYFAGGE